jgi:hypothetical protein
MSAMPGSKLPPPGLGRPPAPTAGDDSLCAHLRACSAPRGLASQVRQALEALHRVTAPRLVSTWFVLLLIATLLALVF